MKFRNNLALKCINFKREIFDILHFVVRPEISIPSTITVVEEQDVVLQCKIIAANPVANVTWRSPDGSETLSPFGRVALTSVNRRQNGVYSCFASNGIGSVSSKATYLSVNCKC